LSDFTGQISRSYNPEKLRIFGKDMEMRRQKKIHEKMTF
jgi:hypothetical protein